MKSILPLARSPFRSSLFNGVLILLLIALASPVQAAGAPLPLPAVSSTFTVNTTGDTVDANLGNGVCADALDYCSLRAAIMEANANSNADVITLPAGTYTLTLANAGGVNEDNSAKGDLDINQSLTITGAGAASTIIQAGTNETNGIDKILGINPYCASVINVTISGVTFRYGRNTQAYGSSDYSHTGGGVDWCGYGASSLSMQNVVITNNTNVNGYGGGMNFDTGDTGGNSTVSLTNVTITNNKTLSSYGTGGGLNIFGGTPTVTISNSQINNNTAANLAVGGGTFIRLAHGGSVFIHNTIIDSNQSGKEGGGVAIVNYASETQVTIDQGSKITNNVSGAVSGGSAGGSGVYLDGSLTTTPVTLSQVTISGNSESALSTSRSGGGGVAIASGNLKLEYSRIVNNTVLSANGSTGLYKDASSGAVSASNNWWGCSSGPAAAPCDTAVIAGGSSGSLIVTPYLKQTITANPASILVNQTSTITTSFKLNSGGQDVSSFLSQLIGLPVNWSATGGSLSGQQTTLQSGGTATAAYLGTTAGSGSVRPTVDNDTASVSVTVQSNVPPTITTIADQIIDQDTSTPALAFTIGDDHTAPGSLGVTGASDNTTLLPNAHIVLGGSGADRTVTLSPAAGQHGTAHVTLTVIDGSGLTNTTTFTLTVNKTFRKTYLPAIQR